MTNGILTIKVPVRGDFVKSRLFGINGKEAKALVDNTKKDEDDND